MTEQKSKIVDQAILTVQGFEKVFKVIYQNSVLQGKSKSTFHNYIVPAGKLSNFTKQ